MDFANCANLANRRNQRRHRGWRPRDHPRKSTAAGLHHWGGAEIAEGSMLERCVVTAGTRVSGFHADADL